MADMQQKTRKGPAKLVNMHSSGKAVAIHEDKNFYLDYGIPGEEVTFFSQRRKQGFRSGEVSEVLAPSPYRTKSFCKHERQCSGCPWQHIKYEQQLALKREILCQALIKYNIHCPEVPAVIPAPELLHYRHRVEYTFASHGYDATGQPVQRDCIGYHKYGEPGHIFDVEECYIQQQPSRSVVEFIKSFAGQQHWDFYDHRQKTGYLRSLSIRINLSGEVMILAGLTEPRPADAEKLMEALKGAFPEIVSLNHTVHLSPSHSQLQGEIISYRDSRPYIFETLGNFKFRIHASSFFQPNTRQAESIFETIRTWAELKGTERVYDLYTGIGTIALYLAAGAKHITGIEGSAKAIEDARENAALNAIPNAEFMVGDILETFNTEFLKKHGKPGLIVLDPPRSGTLIEIKKTINNSGAQKVIYLSCNPVSLAFDLKQLTEEYKVTKIQPFDMLPQTQHLETLVLLERLKQMKEQRTKNKESRKSVITSTGSLPAGLGLCGGRQATVRGDLPAQEEHSKECFVDYNFMC